MLRGLVISSKMVSYRIFMKFIIWPQKDMMGMSEKRVKIRKMTFLYTKLIGNM